MSSSVRTFLATALLLVAAAPLGASFTAAARPAATEPGMAVTGNAAVSSAPWEALTLPAPLKRSAQSLDVTCAGLGFCVALSTYTTSGGQTAPLIEHRTAGRWRIVARPALPAHLIGMSFDAVACPSVTSCVAIGSTATRRDVHRAVAYSWNGSAWAPAPVSVPPGTASTRLVDVSCLSATLCMAVGNRWMTTDPSRLEPLAMRWNGRTWRDSGAKVPDATAASALASVSCVPSVCVAAGTIEYGPREDAVFAERWTGGHWALTGPTGSTVWGRVKGVSCNAPDSCLVVGAYAEDAVTLDPVALRWDGASWTPVDVGGLDPGESMLDSVACTAGGRCLVSGHSLRNGPIARQTDGTTWSAAGAPPMTAVRLWCSPHLSCFGVPGHDTRYTTNPPLLTFDGTAWSSQHEAAMPGPADATLSAVSCPTSSACVAVGSATTGGQRAFIETQDGQRWTPQLLPPARRTDATLSGVACAAAGMCLAVGATNDRHGRWAPLVARSSAGAWHVDSAPLPSDGVIAAFAAVSCTAIDACTAVGWYGTASHVRRPLAELWNGRQWTVTPVYVTDTTAWSKLDSVSCTGPDACVAVGSRSDAPAGWRPLTAVWDGARWQAVEAAAPPDSLGTRLTAVSCTSAEVCIAVGGTSMPGFVDVALAERWNGTQWTVMTPAPPRTVPATFDAVACVADRTCVAVGYTTASTGTRVRLVRALDSDGRWRAIPIQRISTGESSLSGISCAPDRRCLAVGGHSGLSQQPLALAGTQAA